MLNVYSCWNICAEHDDTSWNCGGRGGGGNKERLRRGLSAVPGRGSGGNPRAWGPPLLTEQPRGQESTHPRSLLFAPPGLLRDGRGRPLTSSTRTVEFRVMKGMERETPPQEIGQIFFSPFKKLKTKKKKHQIRWGRPQCLPSGQLDRWVLQSPAGFQEMVLWVEKKLFPVLEWAQGKKYVLKKPNPK